MQKYPITLICVCNCNYRYRTRIAKIYQLKIHTVIFSIMEETEHWRCQIYKDWLRVTHCSQTSTVFCNHCHIHIGIVNQVEFTRRGKCGESQRCKVLKLRPALYSTCCRTWKRLQLIKCTWTWTRRITMKLIPSTNDILNSVNIDVIRIQLSEQES